MVQFAVEHVAILSRHQPRLEPCLAQPRHAQGCENLPARYSLEVIAVCQVAVELRALAHGTTPVRLVRLFDSILTTKSRLLI